MSETRFSFESRITTIEKKMMSLLIMNYSVIIVASLREIKVTVHIIVLVCIPGLQGRLVGFVGF